MREKEEKAIFSEEGDKDDGEEKRKALSPHSCFLFLYRQRNIFVSYVVRGKTGPGRAFERRDLVSRPYSGRATNIGVFCPPFFRRPPFPRPTGL